jgi:iron complex outermembrane receptor protein
MQISNKRKLSLAVSAALATTLTSGVALGQNDKETVEEVVVTGSRIIRANLESSSPVTELSSEQIQLTGLTRIEDVLSSLPSVSLSQSSGQAIESDGTATLELRRLGY